MIVIVSGFAGSGKSTLTEKLATKFKLKPIHASDILHQLKDKRIEEIDLRKTSASNGWWESEEAKNYLKERSKNTSMDETLDKKLLEIIKKEDNIVIDSKTMGNLSKKGFKVWLSASPQTRAKRVAERDKTQPNNVLKTIVERDEIDKKIYKKLYNFELGKDLEHFHLAINTDKLSEEDVFGVVSLVLKLYFKRN